MTRRLHHRSLSKGIGAVNRPHCSARKLVDQSLIVHDPFGRRINAYLAIPVVFLALSTGVASPASHR
jgi:hypothetical protein